MTQAKKIIPYSSRSCPAIFFKLFFKNTKTGHEPYPKLYKILEKFLIVYIISNNLDINEDELLERIKKGWNGIRCKCFMKEALEDMNNYVSIDSSIIYNDNSPDEEIDIE